MATTKTSIGNAKAAALDPQTDSSDDVGRAAPQSPEEREEELVAREEALYAREQRLAAIESRMLEQIERMERANKGTPTHADLADVPAKQYDERGVELPGLDMSMPYGIVIGDPDGAGFVQNGHRFSKDRRYMQDEPKGVGKPFNIAMLGLVKAAKSA